MARVLPFLGATGPPPPVANHRTDARRQHKCAPRSPWARAHPRPSCPSWAWAQRQGSRPAATPSQCTRARWLQSAVGHRQGVELGRSVTRVLGQPRLHHKLRKWLTAVVHARPRSLLSRDCAANQHRPRTTSAPLFGAAANANPHARAAPGWRAAGRHNLAHTLSPPVACLDIVKHCVHARQLGGTNFHTLSSPGSRALT